MCERKREGNSCYKERARERECLSKREREREND